MSNKQFIRASNILSSSNTGSQAWSQGYSNSQDVISGGGSSDNSSSQGFLSANQRHKELQQILTAIDKATENILSIVLPIKSKLDENTIKLSIVSQQQKVLIEALSGVKNDIKQINNNSNNNSNNNAYNNSNKNSSSNNSSNSESSLTINNVKSSSSPLSRSSNNTKTNNNNNNNNVQSEDTWRTSKAQRTSSAKAEEDSVLLDTINTAPPKTSPSTNSASSAASEAPALLSSSLSTSSQTPTTTPTRSICAPSAACSNITDPNPLPNPNPIEPSKENTSNPNQPISEEEDIEISEYLNHRVLKNKDKEKDKEKDSWNIKRKRDIDEKDPFDEDLFG